MAQRLLVQTISIFSIIGQTGQFVNRMKAPIYNFFEKTGKIQRKVMTFLYRSATIRRKNRIGGLPFEENV
jgi:uncharacterized protein YdeI (BOF family)